MSNENLPKPSPSGNLLNVETWGALKAAGYSESELLADQPTGPIIFAYTRQMAIDDGVLVDLTGQPDPAKLVREAGIKIPLAMTATAFGEAVASIDGGDLPAGQSWKGRLWDVLMLLRVAIRKSGGQTDRVHFQVSVDVDGTGQHNKTVSLWSLVGPGDTAAPVMTIMLEGED